MKQYKAKDIKPQETESSSASAKSSAGKRRREAPESVGEKQSPCLPPQYVDSSHCLAVAKGLLTLVLAMDHSCSADLFLLSCKVRLELLIARMCVMSF